MRKKFLLGLIAVLAVVAGVAVSSAFEAHVINVTAKIENALSVTPEEIMFGTVFPQEKLYKSLTISMSDSFFNEDRVNDINYVIAQKPKPRNPEDWQYCLGAWADCGQYATSWKDCFENYYDLTICYPPICPYISKLPDGEPSPGNDVGLEAPDFWGYVAQGRLAKSESDVTDDWTIDLVVPCFEGMCDQGYDWEEFGYPLPPELESEMFGCDLWIEVTGISEASELPHSSECSPGAVWSCNTGKPGICEIGTKTCDTSGYWGECVPKNSPSAEVCDDDLDNDCDGLTDCEDTLDCSEDPACYQPTVLEDWQYRKKLTIDSTKIDSNLSDFPILVKLTSANFDFSKARSDGYDIRFTQSDGTTLLKYEREIHDSGNQLAGYWVKVPSVASGADTEIYVYYGNAVASDGADPTNVWDGDFAGVWHLKESDSVVTIEDSTAYNNDLAKKTGPEPSVDEGKIAKAQHFDGTNDYIKGTTFLDGGPSNATFEGWFKPDINYDSSLASDIRLITKGYAFDLRISADNGRIRNTYAFSTNGTWNWVSNMDTSTNSWTAGNWYKITVVLGSNGREIWVNGTKEKTSLETKSLNANTDYDYTLAANFNQSINFFDGTVDENRVSFVDRGDAWIKASYHSDNDSLLTFGSEETL